MNDISIGRVFGFPVVIQSSALFLVGIYVLFGAQRGGASALAFGLLTGVVILASVLVHELGHAFVARAYRLGPIDITLHGFGGQTRFGREPASRQGILVTLAGPGASILLGVLALGVALTVDAGMFGRLLDTIVFVNLFWGVFNLLPMFPLDGGLITWHGLSLVMAKDRALRWAARLGVLVAVGVGTVAVLLGEIFIAIVPAMALMRSVPLALEPPARSR